MNKDKKIHQLEKIVEMIKPIMPTLLDMIPKYFRLTPISDQILQLQQAIQDYENNEN